MKIHAKALFCVAFFLSTYVYADVLPGTAQPEQINRSMSSTIPDINPNTPPGNVEFPPMQPGPGDAQAKKIKFKLNGVQLSGNKVYSAADLAPIYQNDLHQTITLARLQEIVQTITYYYRSHGYISSRAILPVQKTKNGIVKIDIVEGTIDQVYVVGKPHKSKALVQKFGNQIAKSEPLNIKTLEKYTLLANEIPATTVHTVIKPSPTKEGASDLFLATEHQNFNGYVAYDNYRTRYIGPQQITVNLAANSFFNSGDLAQVIFAKTPKGHELTFLNVNYDFALDANGDRMLLGVIHDKTRPLFVLQPFKIDGEDDNYFTTFSFPQIRAADQSLTFFLNANYENTDVTTFNKELYTDQIRSLGFGTAYSNSDRFMGVNSIYADVRQGLPIFGYTIDTDPLTARTSHPGGHAVYTKFDLSLSRLQSLFWHFSIYGLVKGQYSLESLLAAEQFAYGGIELGRGYDIAELLGDRAVAGTIEGRFDMSINRLKISSLQFYTFYDFGKVWNSNPLGLLPSNQSAASAGVGARFYFNKYVSGNVTWAQPLTKQVAAEELIGRGRLPRTFFGIVASI